MTYSAMMIDVQDNDGKTRPIEVVYTYGGEIEGIFCGGVDVMHEEWVQFHQHQIESECWDEWSTRTETLL